jgi:hypothetical protein
VWCALAAAPKMEDFGGLRAKISTHEAATAGSNNLQVRFTQRLTHDLAEFD